ncbi:hypothetical protein KKC94_03030, partial [Patescibacteria group bacterium]|nr:hypothetical protein [Patescibacteria group bacterium]
KNEGVDCPPKGPIAFPKEGTQKIERPKPSVSEKPVPVQTAVAAEVGVDEGAEESFKAIQLILGELKNGHANVEVICAQAQNLARLHEAGVFNPVVASGDLELIQEGITSLVERGSLELAEIESAVAILNSFLFELGVSPKRLPKISIGTEYMDFQHMERQMFEAHLEIDRAIDSLQVRRGDVFVNPYAAEDVIIRCADVLKSREQYVLDAHLDRLRELYAGSIKKFQGLIGRNPEKFKAAVEYINGRLGIESEKAELLVIREGERDQVLAIFRPINKWADWFLSKK